MLAVKLIRLDINNYDFLKNDKKIHHVIARPFIVSSRMSSSSGEAIIRSFHAEIVSGAEKRKLGKDEDNAEVVRFLNPPIAPDFDIAENDGEECVK